MAEDDNNGFVAAAARIHCPVDRVLAHGSFFPRCVLQGRCENARADTQPGGAQHYASRASLRDVTKSSATLSPQTFGSRSEESCVSQLLAHGTQPAGGAARKYPGARSRVDRTIDVAERSFVESPAPRLESFELHWNGEGAHGPFSIAIEIAFEVAQPEGHVGIDRLARAESGVVRFCDAPPHVAALIKRQAVAVIGDRVDPHEKRRMAQLAERGAREQNAAVALRLAVAHDNARRSGPAPFVIRQLVEKSLDVRRTSQLRQNATLSCCPAHPSSCLKRRDAESLLGHYRQHHEKQQDDELRGHEWRLVLMGRDRSQSRHFLESL